ncbi:hypothetical protein H4684_003518 [Desulfomicrobium macestii]|uniref:Uncharacterized protein n=2 Tax=Desulfomicrobium TaxID=898 RepID=A0A8G2C4Q0_DESNO|nr:MULTISPECIES: hypothetical protein [Desulfomicrobium]MBE1426842.1 hypothetical protein [Desulfomicrobium macestii]SFM00811.1 hypothetical protein SAMN05421830_11172 [Desulfomicrobium norvegicum]
MCFKLDNGSELFSVQDMHRLRKKSSGAMGARSWVLGACGAHDREVSAGGGLQGSDEADAPDVRARKG